MLLLLFDMFIGLLFKLGDYVQYWMHVLSITSVAPETTDSMLI